MFMLLTCWNDTQNVNERREIDWIKCPKLKSIGNVIGPIVPPIACAYDMVPENQVKHCLVSGVNTAY